MSKPTTYTSVEESTADIQNQVINKSPEIQEKVNNNSILNVYDSEGNYVSEGSVVDGDGPLSGHRLAYNRDVEEDRDKSLDTWETDHGPEWINSATGKKKMLRQRKALARLIGEKDISKITNEDVFLMGEASKAKLSGFLQSADGTNIVNTAGDTFDSSIPEDTRTLGLSYKNAEGIDARAFMNNPMDNANYYNKYNIRGRAENEIGSRDLKNDQEISDFDAQTTRKVDNAGLLFRDGGNNISGDIGDLVARGVAALSSEVVAGESDISTQDEEAFARIQSAKTQAQKEAKLEFDKASKTQKIDTITQQGIDSLYGDPSKGVKTLATVEERTQVLLRNKLSKEDLKFLDQKGEGTKTVGGSKPTGLAALGLQSKSIKTVDDRYTTLETKRKVRAGINAVGNATLSDPTGGAKNVDQETGAPKDFKTGNSVLIDKASKDVDVVSIKEEADKLHDEGKYVQAAGKWLEGAGTRLVKHPEAAILGAIQSAPEIAAMITIPTLAIMGKTNSNYEDGKNTFFKERGRFPNKQEQGTLLITSTVSALVEKAGAEAIAGKPGKAAGKYLAELISNKLGMSVGRATVMAVGATFEGGEELLVGILEQVGKNQGKDKVLDSDKLYDQWTAGVGSGAVMKGVLDSPTVPSAIKKDLRASLGLSKKTINKAVNKIPSKQANTKPTDEVTKNVVKDVAVTTGVSVDELTTTTQQIDNDSVHDFTSQVSGTEKTVTGESVKIDTTSAVSELDKAISEPLDSSASIAKAVNARQSAAIALQEETRTYMDNPSEKVMESIVALTGQIERAKGIIDDAIKEDNSDLNPESVEDVGILLTRGSAAVAEVNTKGMETELGNFVQELTEFDKELASANSARKNRNMREVSGEVLGSRTNGQNKAGLGQHLANLGAAVASSNLNNAKQAIQGIVNFKQLQQAKHNAITKGFDKYKKTGKPVTVIYGKDREYIVSGSNTEGFLSQLQTEIDLIDKAAKLGGNLGEAKFFPNSYTARRLEEKRAVNEENKTLHATAASKPASVGTKLKVKFKASAVPTRVEGTVNEPSEAGEVEVVNETTLEKTPIIEDSPEVESKPKIEEKSKVDIKESNDFAAAITGELVSKKESKVLKHLVDFSSKVRQMASTKTGEFADSDSSKLLRPLREMLSVRNSVEETTGLINDSVDLFEDIKQMSDDRFNVQEWIAVQQIEQFTTEMREALDNIMPKVGDKNGLLPSIKDNSKVIVFRELANRSPLFQFMNEDGQLPKAVKDAISIAVLDWVQSNGSATMYQSPSDVYRFFGKDERQNDLAEGAINALSGLGSHATPQAETIGYAVLKYLNIQQSNNSDLDGLWETRLAQSIGDMSLIAMSNMTTSHPETEAQENRGYIEFNDIPTSVLNELSGEVVEGDIVDGEDTTVATFVRLPLQLDDSGYPQRDSNNKVVLGRSLQQLMDLTKSTPFKSVMKSITGTKRSKRGVTATPSTSIPEYITGTTSKLSPVLKEYVKALNSQVMVKNPQWALMQAYKDNPSEWLRMHGWVDPATFDSMHSAEVVSANGKNLGLEREFDQMLQHEAEWEAGLADVESDINRVEEEILARGLRGESIVKLDKHLTKLEAEREGYINGDIYINHHVISTGRVNDRSDTLSIQRSKMHRNALSFKDHVETININNKAHRYAVVAGLLEPLGLSALEFSGSEPTKEFHDKFLDSSGKSSDPVINKAIEALQKAPEGDFDQSAITDAVLQLGEGPHSLNALMVVAEWSKAIKEGKDSFISHGYTEVDGTTNGVIASMRQLVGGYTPTDARGNPSEDIKTKRIRALFNAGGQVFTDQEFSEGIEYLQNNPDAYQNIGALAGKIIKPLSTSVEGQDLVTLSNKIDEAYKELNNVKNADYLTQEQAYKKVQEAEAAYGIKIFGATLPDFGLGKNGKVTDDIRKMMKAVVMPGGYQAGDTALANSLFNSWLETQYKNIGQGDIENINDTLRNAGFDEVTNITAKNIFPSDTVKGLRRIYVKSLGTVITSAYRESMGDFNQNAKTINAAYGVMGIIVAKVINDSIAKLEKLKGSALTNTEILNERKRLQEEESLFVGYRQVGSTSSADAISIVKEKKEVVSKDRGGYVFSATAENIIRTNTYRVNEQGVLTRNTNGKAYSSRTSRIKETIADPDVGVSGMVTTVIGIDAMTQALSMLNKLGSQGNLYDAKITSMLNAASEASNTNKTWDGIHRDWSLWDAVGDQLNHLVTKYQYETATELNEFFKQQQEVLDIDSGDAVLAGNKFAPNYLNHDGSTSYFAGLSDFMKYYKEQQELGNSQRESVNKDIDGSGNYLINGGMHWVNDNQTNTKGSSDQRVDVNSFDMDSRERATPERVNELFQTYRDKNNITDSLEHKERLTELMDKYVLPLVSKSEGYTITVDSQPGVTGGAVVNAKDVYIRTSDTAIRQFSTDMSDAEVITHEFLHPIIEAGLADNTKAIKDLSTLQKQVIESTTFTPQSLLDPLEVNQEVALEKAQRLYDYITGDIHEFMTFGLSNNVIRKALEKEKISNKATETTIDKMLRILSELVEQLTGKVIGRTTNETNIASNLDNMIDSFDTSVRVHRARQVASIVNNKYVTAGRGFLADKVAKPITKWGKSVSYKTPVGEIQETGEAPTAREIGTTIAKLPSKLFDEGFQKASVDIAQSITDHRTDFLSKTAREIMGATEVDEKYHVGLNQVNEHVDSAALRHSKITKESIVGAFKRTLKSSEQKLLADTLLRGDLKVFRNMSMDDLATLVSSTIDLDTRTVSTIQKLKSTDKTWINNQTKNLASVMIDGEAIIENGNLNAFNIVTGVNHPNGRGLDVNDLEAVNELKSLYAIKRMSVVERNLLRNFIVAEGQGIKTMLDVDAVNHQDTLENIYMGDRSREIAGEVISKSTNRSSTVIKSRKEHEIHTAQGLTLVRSLGSKFGLYSRPNTPNDGYQKGIFSMGNSNLEGTVIEPGETSGGPISLPIVKGGRVIGHRMVMNRKTRELDAGMSIGAAESLGNHSGRNVRLSKGDSYNAQIISMARKDYLSSKDTRAFIRIDTTSKNLQVREFAKLMPREMRRAIQEEWNGPMYLRKNQLDLLLGFRKLSLVDSINGGLSKVGVGEMNAAFSDTLRLSGDVWQGVVSEVKKRTVLFTPMVVTANFTSNLAVSVLHGMNPVDVVRDQFEGLQAIRAYTAWQDELAALDLSIKIGNDVARDTKERARIQKLLESSGAHSMVQAGMFQSIVEDIDITENGGASPLSTVAQQVLSNNLNNQIEEVYSSAPESIKKGIGIVMLSPSTEFGANVQAATAYSDFIARYAMMKHLRKKGVPEKTAMKDVRAIFVDYSPNTSREMQYINDSGLYMYTKFLLRIQSVIMRAFRNHPEAVIGFEAAQQILGDSADIVDSSLLWGLSLSGGRTITPDEAAETILQLPLFYMFGGLKDIL